MKYCHKTVKLIAVILTLNLVAAAGSTFAADERWFEVELIVFKSNRQINFEEESWKDDIKIERMTNTVQLTSSQPEGSAFQKLSEEQLQLTQDAQSLSRHPDYEVLTHVAWRQPMTSFKSSPHIRITGGQNFSSEFNYDGTKLDSFDQQSNAYLSQDGNAITIENSPEKNQFVPELDGSIKVYLKRFLHIRTDLFLRKPGQAEVKTEELLLSNNNNMITNTENGYGLNNPAANSHTNNQNLAQGENLAQGDSLEQSNQFSWEIGDNFLESDSQKIYVERLFNYQLKQARRVKSKELHYFDHPLLGLLINIRPL
jgi:hypothetical protein